MRKLIASLLIFAGGPAFAEEGGWSFSGAVYMWFADTTLNQDTPNGAVEAGMSFGDALAALDFGMMGAFEARNGKWGFLGDLIYLSLSQDARIAPGSDYSKVHAKSDIAMLSGYALYRVSEDAMFNVDFGGGLRASFVDSEVTFRGEGVSPRRFDGGDDWVDPLLATRVQAKFSDKWSGAVLMDAGGFGVGSESTWQVMVSAAYRINENWVIQGGYRHLETRMETGPGDLDYKMSGPLLGLRYDF